MRTNALIKLGSIAALLLVAARVSHSSASPSTQTGSEPRITAFYRGTSGGLRIVVFYPDTKKLYMYKDDGSCGNSWTLGNAGAPLSEDKCK